MKLFYSKLIWNPFNNTVKKLYAKYNEGIIIVGNDKTLFPAQFFQSLNGKARLFY
jgi:hypothetical protein